MPALIFCIGLFVAGALMSHPTGILPSGLRILFFLFALGGLIGLATGFIRSLFSSHGNVQSSLPPQTASEANPATASPLSLSVKSRLLAVMAFCGVCASVFASRPINNADIKYLVVIALAALLSMASFVYPAKKLVWVSMLVVLMCVSLTSLRTGFDQSQIGLAIATGSAFAGLLVRDVAQKPMMNPIGSMSRERMNRAPSLPPEIGPGFSGVAGMCELKSKLLDVSTEAMTRGGKQVRNGVLLHGEPGNGKTFIVEALAQQLKVPLLRMTYGEVGSKWVGETTEKIITTIKQARESAPCLLFIDEADSLLEARGRNSGGGGGDYDRTVNVLLTEIVNLRGSGVLVIAATNFLNRLDSAAIREGRFDFKVEVPNPDMEARIALLSSGIKRNAGGIYVAPEVIESAGRRWNGFSVKRILAITEQIPHYAKKNNISAMSYVDINKVLREVQGPRAMAPEGTKSVDELVLTTSLRKTISGLVLRMVNTFEIEQAGGTLPTGLLFSGPPGTGKTETARALAKSSGWAFIATTGNDLLQDPAKIERIKREAMDLRPCLIFIDEADDLLMNREFSNARNATNKLLAVMDGANGRVADIIWIAATNHPENLDPAVLRGGRFAEKFEFTPPGNEALQVWADAWLAKKGWTTNSAIEYPASMTIADGEAVLQRAINAAIARTRDFTVRQISKEDLDLAFSS